jgi:hypothetical protein
MFFSSGNKNYLAKMPIYVWTNYISCFCVKNIWKTLKFYYLRAESCEMSDLAGGGGQQPSKEVKISCRMAMLGWSKTIRGSGKHTHSVLVSNSSKKILVSKKYISSQHRLHLFLLIGPFYAYFMFSGDWPPLMFCSCSATALPPSPYRDCPVGILDAKVVPLPHLTR